MVVTTPVWQLREPIDRLVGAVLFVTAFSVTEAAHAGGYHIDEQDARATGRAGAVTANPGNASSIYYNPAGIATLRGLRIDAGEFAGSQQGGRA